MFLLPTSVRMIVMSHLSDLQIEIQYKNAFITNDERINFVKYLINKYPDTTTEVIPDHEWNDFKTQNESRENDLKSIKEEFQNDLVELTRENNETNQITFDALDGAEEPKKVSKFQQKLMAAMKDAQEKFPETLKRLND